MKRDELSVPSTCPCGSNKNAAKCCLVFINETQAAPDAERLMRSRYTAYALGKDRYIVDTWHRSTRPHDLDLDKSVKWTGLSILSRNIEKSNVAYVEFVARFNNDGVAGQMHERSRFLFEDGRWFYVDGEPFFLKKPGRNDPCFCGSGKKFKKCCGKK